MKAAVARRVGWLVLACALPGARAVAAEAAGPPPTAEEIEHEIEVFRTLHRMKLDAAQAREIAFQIKPVLTLRDDLTRQRNQPEVIAVMLAMRAAAVAGQPIPDGLWEKLVAAERVAGARGPEGEDDPGPADRLQHTARQAADAIVQQLRDEQLTPMIDPWLYDRTEDLFHQIAEARGRPPREWQQWMDEFVAEVAGDREDAGEAFVLGLRTLLDRLRKLTPDQFYEEREGILSDLRGALAEKLPRPERLERAAWHLTDWMLTHHRLPLCLTEYADAVEGGR